MKKILVFLSVFLLTLSQAFAFTFEYNNKSYTVKDEFIENIFCYYVDEDNIDQKIISFNNFIDTYLFLQLNPVKIDNIEFEKFYTSKIKDFGINSEFIETINSWGLNEKEYKDITHFIYESKISKQKYLENVFKVNEEKYKNFVEKNKYDNDFYGLSEKEFRNKYIEKYGTYELNMLQEKIYEQIIFPKKSPYSQFYKKTLDQVDNIKITNYDIAYLRDNENYENLKNDEDYLIFIKDRISLLKDMDKNTQLLEETPLVDYIKDFGRYLFNFGLSNFKYVIELSDEKSIMSPNISQKDIFDFYLNNISNYCNDEKINIDYTYYDLEITSEDKIRAKNLIEEIKKEIIKNGFDNALKKYNFEYSLEKTSYIEDENTYNYIKKLTFENNISEAVEQDNKLLFIKINNNDNINKIYEYYLMGVQIKTNIENKEFASIKNDLNSKKISLEKLALEKKGYNELNYTIYNGDFSNNLMVDIYKNINSTNYNFFIDTDLNRAYFYKINSYTPISIMDFYKIKDKVEYDYKSDYTIAFMKQSTEENSTEDEEYSENDEYSEDYE